MRALSLRHASPPFPSPPGLSRRGPPTGTGLRQRCPLIRLLEAAEDLVAAIDDLVERLLHGRLVAKNLLEAVAELTADLQEVAEADAPRPAAAAIDVEAGDSGLAALVGRLVVEAVRLHVVEAGFGNGDVAGHRRPEQRLLRLRDEIEEGSGCLVF